MKSGIYTITNLVDGKMYVGFAIKFTKRRLRHWKDLRAQKHKNRHLQSAWNKYGAESFKFEVLEEWPEELLCCMEHYWCNLLNVHDDRYGYNIRPTHPYGLPRHSEETRKKISAVKTGCKQKRSSIEKMIETRKRTGTNKRSEECKKKIAAVHKGRKHSEDAKEKMRKRVYTEEIRKRMSEAGKGRKVSDEHKKKISEGNKGKKLSEETKLKLRNAHLGKVISKEQRKKISVAKSIPILQCDMEGNVIREWFGINEAARELKMQASCINYVCLGKQGRTQHGGYRWKFKKDGIC